MHIIPALAAVISKLNGLTCFLAPLLPTPQAVLESCDPATLAGKRDRVLLVLGYALYSRRSELAALHIEDVSTPNRAWPC